MRIWFLKQPEQIVLKSFRKKIIIRLILAKKLKTACPYSTVVEGLAFAGTDAQNDQEGARNAVNKWLSGLGKKESTGTVLFDSFLGQLTYPLAMENESKRTVPIDSK